MNTDPTTLLIRAASEGDYEEMCEILNLHLFDPLSINQALYAAVSKSQSASDHLRCIESLFSRQGNPNFKDANDVSLLMIAAKLGQIQLAELLIDRGSAVDDRDKDFRTPLMYAVESGYGDNVDVVKFLLEKKAKVGIQDALGNTALHKSAEKGYLNSMQVLLDFGAFINAENKGKETPLHLACKHSCEACIELLIEKKANVHILNSAGKAPLDIVPDSLKYLFDKPQENNSDSSFCSISSHNEVSCKVCKKGMQEGICKSCYEINLQYSNQTLVENRKIIEEYAKDITELKAVNCEVGKKLKEVQENCAQLRRALAEKEAEIRRKDLETGPVVKLLKEMLAGVEEELRGRSEKLKEAEEEIVSLKEHLINARSENRLHRSESELLRKRMEETSKDLESSPMKSKKVKKVTYLKPVGQCSLPTQVTLLKDEIHLFMQEIEKWQEEVDPIYSELTSKIKRLIKKRFSGSNIEIYGSYATKLHLPSSDIDMVIVNLEGEKREALRTIDRLLRNQPYTLSTTFIQNALVPLIKLKTELMGKSVQIDITINDTNHTGLKCLGVVNRLISQFSAIRPVFLILKHLLYVCNFKEPYNGGLGSYSLFLMVASFLQKRGEQDRVSSELQIAENLNEFMTFYVNQATYLAPIVTNDPAGGSFRERDGFDNYMSLVVVDPINQMNNVAFSTNLGKLIHIFTIADYNLKRVCLCDCTFSCSPLYRMIYETKDYIRG